MYYKISEDGQRLISSKIEGNGFKPLKTIPYDGEIPEGAKAEVRLYETDTHIVSEQYLVEKTALEKIFELEESQTPRLIREALLGEEEARNKLQVINEKIKSLRDYL